MFCFFHFCVVSTKFPEFYTRIGTLNQNPTQFVPHWEKIDDRWGQDFNNMFREANLSRNNLNTSIIEKLAQFEYPPALHYMGELYLYGIDGYPINFSIAYDYFRRSSEYGYNESLSSMSLIQRLGILNEIDDQVLLKSDGMPTYHLANVVDDHLMEITHVRI